MDRIDFSKSIDVDPVTQVKCYFTEIMTMYNLCEGRNYNLLRGFVNEENVIQFIVSFSSPMEAMCAANIMLNKDIPMYNKVFHIGGSITGTNISLIFKEK